MHITSYYYKQKINTPLLTPKVLLDYLRPMIAIHLIPSRSSTYSCEDNLSIEDLI